MVNTELIKQLQVIREEYMAKVRAIDTVIDLARNVVEDLTPTVTADDIPEEPTPKKARKARKTSFTSAAVFTTDGNEIDMSKIPDYNPHGGGIRGD